jgi:hypothetical protein
MRQRALLAVCILALPMLALSQGAPLKVPAFTHLQHQATEVVDVTIGSLPLGIASLFMDEADPESAQMKAVLKDLKSIQVRSYKFDSDAEYSKSDVDTVRTQLAGQGWSQLVQTRNRKEGEDVDVFVSLDKDKVTGFAVVVTEPREFTIVNVVGSVDLQQLAQLQKRFNLPGVSLAQANDSQFDPRVP